MWASEKQDEKGVMYTSLQYWCPVVGACLRVLRINCARLWFVYKTGLHQCGVLHLSGALQLERCVMKKASTVAGFLRG
jgi:hypothetical protein